MPLYLEPCDIHSQVQGLGSVLIAPCRICPSMSLSVAAGEPYIEPLKRFLSTRAYARAINKLRAELTEKGIKAAVFQSDLPVPLMCIWTTWQRQWFLKKAKQFDGVVVLGCDSAAYMVGDILKDESCRVVQGMTVKGIVSVTPRFGWTGAITLEIKDQTCVRWPRESI